MIDAIAMIGTACCGPKITTSTGISMIDEPKPTIPPMTPATRPTLNTKKYSKDRLGRCVLRHARLCHSQADVEAARVAAAVRYQCERELVAACAIDEIFV